MCGASELVCLITYKLLRVMIQVGTVSWKHLSVSDEAIYTAAAVDSKGWWFSGRNYVIVFVLQLYGMQHSVCERVVGCDQRGK